MVGKRLLLIEDDIDSLNAVSALLRDAGHQVLAAATGRDGLRILHAGTPLDLVVLDFWLPDMTGHALLATRTRWPGSLSLPVLLLTGDDAWVDENDDLRQLGVVGLLRKPVDSQQLLDAIEQATKAAAFAPQSMTARRLSEAPTSSVTPGVARQARRLSDLLVRASELLAQSVDATAQLADVARLAVPGMAELCLIEQLSDGISERQLLCAVHADPNREPELRKLAEPRPLLLPCIAEVLETGQPQLHGRVSDEQLRGWVDSDEAATALRALGFDSVIIVPMIARRRVFGAMTWGSPSQTRPYTRAHLDTAKDLAHRIALALDNDQLQRRAQLAQRARDELLSILSYDLRAPLGAIVSSAVGSLQRASSPVQAEEAAGILRHARGMERLLRDLLDYSQLETGNLRVNLRKERLSDLLGAAVEAQRLTAGKQTLLLEIDTAVRNFEVMCDRERIAQVLSNLIADALRRTSAQGRVSVGLALVDGEAMVTVSDSARALPAEQCPLLFSRSPNDAAPSIDGARSAGLGLYVARGLVEAHGGRIWVHSEPGHGNSFCFTLRPSEQPALTSDVAPLPPILLVDDDVVFRRELLEILRERGYSVETADNGWQAWNYLQVNAPPALILLDLMMPVMDGWELHAAIKSHPVLASVPTVVVSCLDRYRIEPSLTDIQGYIEKPIRTAQLLEIVQQFVPMPTPRRDSAQWQLLTG